jgi:hypothetical protein
MKIEMEPDPHRTPQIADRSVHRMLLDIPDARANYWYRLVRYEDDWLRFHRDVPVIGQAVDGDGNPAKPLKAKDKVTVGDRDYTIASDLSLWPIAPAVVPE